MINHISERMKQIHRILSVFLLLTLCPLLGISAENPKPFVIPELTSWKGAEGSFTPNGRIVIADNAKALRPIAQALQADYQAMFGRQLSIAQGKAKTGDIVLSLRGVDSLGQEGYYMRIGDSLHLSAHQPQGLYWATRTLLQLSEQSQDRSIPKGESTDIPSYRLRGLLLDVARKYIPMDYLHSLVKVMAYYKMNTLQVHLNDNGFKQFFAGDWAQTSSAFRLESSTYPELAIKGASYSKKEFIDFQIMAEQHYVEIIPEIDVPAHSLAFAHIRPEIGSHEYGMDHLDLFKDETYQFVDALLHEYLSGKEPVFRGKRINIGTDEYSNAKEEVREKFRYFTDRYIKFVQKYGKQASLWGSLTHAYGKTPVTSKDVLMMCWYNGYAAPLDMKAAGYQLVSIPDGYTYIVPAAGYYYDYLNVDMLHKSWTPAQVGNVRLEDGDPSLEGGMFAVWNDHYGNGISVKDIHHRIMPAMQVMALKTWTAHKTSVPLEEYKKKSLTLSEAPGVNELGILSKTKGVVYELSTLEAGSKLPHEEIGYNYKVTFTIEAQPEEKGTELLRSRNAVFYLSDPRTGRLGFARDGYLNTFNYTLPQSGKVELSVEGTNRETRLYVNGQLHQKLDAQMVIVHNEANKLDVQYEAPDPFTPTVYTIKDKMYYQRTLVFPLKQAGKFRSQVSKLKVEHID